MEEDKEKELTNEEKENPKQEQNVEVQKQEENLEIQNLEQNVETPNHNQEVIEENPNEKGIIEVKKKKRRHRKGSYITGTIGALLGGAVAVLPWIAKEIFAEDNFAFAFFAMLCSILIPVGAYLGYKIFIGKIRKPLKGIIAVISILLITAVTTIICPIIWMLQAGYSLTFENWRDLYSDVREDVREIIIEETVAGLTFVTIGIVITIKSLINKKIKNLMTAEELQAIEEEPIKQLKEKSEMLKNVCIALNCMNSENAVNKKEILKELKKIYNLRKRKCKKYFSVCVSAKLLRKHKGKYYYDENDEENKVKRAKKVNSKIKIKNAIKVLIKLTIIVAIGFGIWYYISNIEEPYVIPGTSIELEVAENQDLYKTKEEMTALFGEQIANGYSFVVLNDENTYEIYGRVISKDVYEGKDGGTVIQEERDLYAPYLGEEVTSQVTDRQIGEYTLKSYDYKALGDDGNEYRIIIYLYETEEVFLWVDVFTYYEFELTQTDEVLDKLFK